MNRTGGHRVASLYLHVPFCARKCAYCAFYSEAGNPAQMARYVEAVLRELEGVAPGVALQTLYIGGGTPSLLPAPLWKRLLDGIHRLRVEPTAEWTVECNPATLSLDKARLLRDHGVNRISLGVQSLEDHLLDRLGRIHSRAAVFRSVDLVRRAGFENLNLDLMFAIPGQTLADWRRTLGEALALGSEHLSCYEVIYEDDTPLFAQLAAGHIDADEDLACAMYDELLTRTAAHGLHQYEIANFARHHAPAPAVVPDHACRHNINYWRGGPFHGLGPSASGFVGGVRTRNCADTRRYCERLERGESPREADDVLLPVARAGEIAAFGLRMNCGWRFEEFSAVTGYDLRQEWGGELKRLTQMGWAELESGGVRLTPVGLRYADAAGAEFLRFP